MRRGMDMTLSTINLEGTSINVTVQISNLLRWAKACLRLSAQHVRYLKYLFKNWACQQLTTSRSRHVLTPHVYTPSTAALSVV